MHGLWMLHKLIKIVDNFRHLQNLCDILVKKYWPLVMSLCYCIIPLKYSVLVQIYLWFIDYNWPLICMHNFPPLPISKQIIPVKYFVISNCPQFCILPCDFSCYFSYVILVVPSLLFFSCYFVTVNHIQNTVYANPQPSSHDDDALYHVVEDLPGNETQENAATCLDVMARNGQICVQKNHYFVWVKNI